MEMKGIFPQNITIDQWREFAEATGMTIPEAQQHYQDFMNEYDPKILEKPITYNHNFNNSLRRKDDILIIEGCALDVNIYDLFIFQVCVDGYIDPNYGRRGRGQVRADWEVKAFRKKFVRDSIVLGTHTYQVCKDYEMLRVGIDFCFGFEVTEDGDTVGFNIILKGELKYWFGSKEFDLILFRIEE